MSLHNSTTLQNLCERVAWVFDEDDFDIDLIIGVRNIKITDLNELTKLAMVDRDPGFAASVQLGDLLVGGRNFSYGHPHCPAMRAMRHPGHCRGDRRIVFAGLFPGRNQHGLSACGLPRHRGLHQAR